MGVVIRNLSSRPLYVALHNGQNVRLAPGATSPSVDEVQVKSNATVEKLVKQRMIAVEEARAESAEPSKAETSAAIDDSEVSPRTRKRSDTAS